MTWIYFLGVSVKLSRSFALPLLSQNSMTDPPKYCVLTLNWNGVHSKVANPQIDDMKFNRKAIFRTSYLVVNLPIPGRTRTWNSELPRRTTSMYLCLWYFSFAPIATYLTSYQVMWLTFLLHFVGITSRIIACWESKKSSRANYVQTNWGFLTFNHLAKF